jgi:hypothetical protein
MDNMIEAFIGQEGGDGLGLIWLLLPLLCCMLSMGGRGEKPVGTSRERDNFYTTQEIEEAFGVVEERINKWRFEAKDRSDDQGGIVSTIRNFLGRGAPPERFQEKDKEPPRLISLNDATGQVYFEFTEVSDGGTVVTATYGSQLKDRVAKLKADMPLKIPATPIGLNCPSCGKPVQKDFELCPYCGETLIKE